MKHHYDRIDAVRLPPQPPDAREHLLRVLDALVEGYGAERIVAFGSCVRGIPTEDSDVDLCVVRRHPPLSTHPGREARDATFQARPRISLDILVRTPEEWNRACQNPFGVMEEVVRHGVLLYER